MPQPGLHVIFARRVLDRWRRNPDLSPFHPSAPKVENHFLHGALAPDMGFFPFSDSRTSRLVHADGSARVARRLLALATTEPELAFAWGWVTHVLADVAIHPLINTAAAEVLAREHGDTAVTRADRQQAHVRVELGLDAWHCQRSPALRGDRLLVHAFDPASIDFLTRALRGTYGVLFDSRRMLKSHRNVTAFFGPYLRLSRVISAEPGDATTTRRPRLRLSHLRAIGHVLLKRSAPAFGFLYPVAPPHLLREAVDGAMRRIERELQAHVATELRDLIDHDLETGQPTADRRTVVSSAAHAGTLHEHGAPLAAAAGT